MKRRAVSLAAALALVVSAFVVGALPAVSADREPSLRLLGGPRRVTMTRFPGEQPGLTPGTHLAAVGGPLEIRVKRVGGEFEAVQVLPRRDGSRRVIRRLPAWAVQDLTQGLHDFFVVTATDRNGQQVLRTRAPLCFAGSYDQARVDDTGPQVPTYPYSCWTSPLAKAAVWGLDRGWASRAPAYVSADLPDGTYTVTVAIAPRYVTLFDVEPQFASTEVRVTLESIEYPPCEGPDGEPCEPCELPEEGCPVPGEPLPMRSGELDHGGAATSATPEVTAGSFALPDLIALPAHNIHAFHDDDVKRDVISFGATVWNRGPGPLVVEGFRRPGRGLMDAYQYLYENGRRVGKLDAGTLEYDTRDGHHHWHFTDFARYRLLDADKSFVRRSRKEAFCLAPTDAIDLTLPTANWQPGSTGLSTACGGAESIWIREILDVGWGDTYHQSLPGQSFDITDVPNGTYFVEVATNPVNNLRERTRANNVAYTKIRLGGSPGRRTAEMR
jgi:hypothetical protein